MRRLTPVDSMFAALDVPGYPMHGMGILFLDPTTAPRPVTFERIREVFSERVPYMPPFRRKLLRVPFGLDTAYWVDDGEFDLDAHLHHSGVPNPGSLEKLLEVLNRIGTLPLDEHRPLWAAWFLEGLDDGRHVLALKAHHAIIDGVGGLAMMGALLDPTPDAGPPSGPRPPFDPDAGPLPGEIALRAAAATFLRPARATRAVGNLVAGLLTRSTGPGRQRSADSAGETGGPSSAPASFNRVASHPPQRNLAMTSYPLDELKRIGTPTGATINQVLLTLVGGAVRRYLVDREELPVRPLTAAVPVNLRTDADDDPYRNNITVALAKVRSDLADPLERLAATVATTRSTAHGHTPTTDPFETAMEVVAPGFLTFFARVYVEQVAGRVALPIHLLVTNVPGPEEPRYLAGAQVDAFHIQMMPFPGLGPIFAALSLAGRLFVSITGTHELTPDIARFAEAMDDEFAALRDSTAP